MQININVFSKLTLPFFMDVVRHDQIANQIAEYFDYHYLKEHRPNHVSLVIDKAGTGGVV